MNISKGLTGAAIAFAFGVQAAADETVTVSYAYRDDGGCETAGHTASAEFVGEYEELGLDVLGYARTAPSGGDCRIDSLSYTVELNKNVGEFKGFDLVASFSADKRSTSALYAIVDAAGDVLARPDGNPSDPVTLPAGAAETVVASLGACRSFSRYELCAGGNVVPVDWSDGASGRTLSLRSAVDLPFSLSLDTDVNIGRHAFGDVTLRWEHGVLNATVRHAFGLNNINDGAPPTQTFAGLPAVVQGAPRSTATVFTIGARFEI